MSHELEANHSFMKMWLVQNDHRSAAPTELLRLDYQEQGYELITNNTVPTVQPEY